MIRLIPPYQHEGVKWLFKKEITKFGPKGGFLCDEMGLGKTVQLLKTMVDNKKPKTLVVVPKSLISQWVSEVKRFTNFTVESFEGSNRCFNESDVCITSYSIIGDSQIQTQMWNRIILDEAHSIRNPNSKMFKECMALKGSIKWVVTGTPIFNNIKDFVTLSRFVGISAGNIQRNYDQIRDEYVLRRTKSAMRTSLIPCKFENVELEMSPAEKSLYEVVYEDFCENIRLNVGMMDILESFLRCRQICVWPQLYYDGVSKKGDFEGEREVWKGSTTKMDYLIESIKGHPTEKTLVFNQFTGEALKIKELMEEHANVFVLNGDTKDRETVIQSFRDSPAPAVFLIQIKTGGVGLNLQEASRVYITHPAWNPATELQAIARAHRTGQLKVVQIKKLIYSHENSIETEIVELQNAKAVVSAKILNDPSLQTQIPKVQTVSKFIFKIGKQIRHMDNPQLLVAQGD
jgi:SNF2 family DNA or RNA helicase